MILVNVGHFMAHEYSFIKMMGQFFHVHINVCFYPNVMKKKGKSDNYLLKELFTNFKVGSSERYLAHEYGLLKVL